MRTRLLGVLLSMGLVAGLLAALSPALEAGHLDQNFVVNSTADDPNDDPGDGDCDTGGTVNGDPECTLRAAIEEANDNPDPAHITFDIDGAGPHTITLGSDLPDIATTMDIDGTTEDACGLDRCVEVDGDGDRTFLVTGTGANGSVLRGLVVGGSSASGVSVTGGAANVTVRDNWVGFRPSATPPFVDNGNASYGISLEGAGANATVRDNVIGFNGDGGVRAGSGNLIRDNLIGIGPDGTTAIPNTGFGGIDALNAGNNVIVDNVISGNDTSGIVLEGAGATGNTIARNLIGTAADGTTALGNSSRGIRVILGASGNTIGGAPGQGNTVAFNGFRGVEVSGAATVGNEIARNSIFDNDGLGIELVSGGNRNQAAPVLTSAEPLAGGTHVTGTLSSAPSESFRIEFFSNEVCNPDATGSPELPAEGEGKTFIEHITVTTNAAGAASFDVTIGPAAPGEDVLTATATRLSTTDTSRFSGCQDIVPPQRFEVNSTSDTGQAPGDIGDGTCEADPAIEARDTCTLRAAIQEANADPATLARITFAIPGPGPHRITLTSSLPLIETTMDIDGTTQTGCGLARCVEVDGNDNFITFVVTGTGANGSVLRGLVVGGSATNGISVAGGAANVTVRDNWVGFRPSATPPFVDNGNASYGIDVFGAGTNTTVRDNVIGFSGSGGVLPAEFGNLIQGNSIGIGPDGTTAVPNTGFGGIDLVGADDNVIVDNVISGNATSGILLEGATGNTIARNLIGTAADGTTPRGNGSRGISVTFGSSGNTIGGAPGQGNTVAFNADEGVAVVGLGAVGNQIARNSIFDNGDPGTNPGALGIALISGGNRDQAAPVLASAERQPGGTHVTGTLSSAPSESFRIEFFSNEVCNPDATGSPEPPAQGEGKTFIGHITVDTNAAGAASFDVTTGPAAPGEDVLTATATRLSTADTSPFSGCQDIEGHADLEVTKTGPATALAGDQVSFGLQVTNHGPLAASGLEVVDDFGPGFENIQVTSSGGFACVVNSPTGTHPAGRDVVCTLSALAAGQTRTIVLSARIQDQASFPVFNAVSVQASSPDDPDLTNNTDQVQVNEQVPPRCPGFEDLTDHIHLVGTPGNDVLIATSDDPHVICGLAGNDHLEGGAGDDVIDAGPGNDFVHGRAGDDLILGRRGNNELRGGPGNDTIRGGRDGSLIFGGPGADRIRTQGGDNLVRGGAGDPNGTGNRIFGGPGDNILVGGPDHDLLRARGDGDNILRGRGGDDRLIGAPGANSSTRFNCGPGTDVAILRGGDNIVHPSCERVVDRT